MDLPLSPHPPGPPPPLAVPHCAELACALTPQPHPKSHSDTLLYPHMNEVQFSLGTNSKLLFLTLST